MQLQINLPNHQYEIMIKKKALNEIGPVIQKLWQNKKIAIITDETVSQLYLKKITQQLEAAGFSVVNQIIPAGEASKSLSTANQLYDFLATENFTRSDGLIALGGGVIGDLTGFVASTFMRGLAFIQIPTSLLAQVDASIGGKTAVNSAKAKNMIGTFYQPDLVVIDPLTLESMEPVQIQEGLAEVIKAGAIADLSLWQALEKLGDTNDFLQHSEEIIEKALTVKKKVVEEDVFDNGQRLLLNFGHTVGHGIENTAGYGKISHGAAVAIGMVQITKISERAGETASGTTEKLKELLAKFNLPISYQPWNQAEIYQAISHDKKARGAAINLILLNEIGEAKIKKIPLTEMKRYLEEGN